MQVIWKVLTYIMRNHVISDIMLIDDQHGFRKGQGIVTSTLESNLVHQLAGICHDTLLQVFLDVCKAYYLI